MGYAQNTILISLKKWIAVKIHATLSPHHKVIIIIMESRERPTPPLVHRPFHGKRPA